MSSAAPDQLTFPSVQWFEALRGLVNADPEFRRIGTVDAVMGVKAGSHNYVLTFEAFECVGVEEVASEELPDVDFYLEMPEADWRDMLENIKEHGEADRSHTLNTLDLMSADGIAKNDEGDQLRLDLFFRLNHSFQYFFNTSAKLDTNFGS